MCVFLRGRALLSVHTCFHNIGMTMQVCIVCVEGYLYGCAGMCVRVEREVMLALLFEGSWRKALMEPQQ